MARRRLDAELVRRGLVATRSEAQAAVREGLVLVGGVPVPKPSTLIEPQDPVELLGPARRFVSRGGDKLDAAIDRFGIEVAGRRCLDAGASTGGFTDCLLARGAHHVVAVDVGYGQLAWSIRRDERVTVLERTNIRDLSLADLPYASEVAVADLSFISLRLVVPVLAGICADPADLVLLVKPQFEAGPAEVGRGGVVRDEAVWARCVEDVGQACRSAGLTPVAVMASPLPGPAGNVEFPLHVRTGPAAGGPDLTAAIEEGRTLAAAGSKGPA
ncbi:MAG TPA: TlyA family RNA methyltransferase [Actinomycetota bacterium]|nr:TlyA family RNA methyltransferase [Actinomycetota bacterium]